MIRKRQSDYDVVRAWVEGELDSTAAAALRKRMAGDPALADTAARYRSAHAATDCLSDDDATCELTFDEVWRTTRTPSRTQLFVLAAAAIVTLAVGAWWVAVPSEPHSSPPTTVVVHAIPLDPRDPVPIPVEIPESLATYRSVTDEGLNWLSDVDQAQAIATAVGRALLVQEHHPHCPFCTRMAQTTFTHDSVRAELEDFVLVRLDLSTNPTRMMQHMRAQVWPYMEVRVKGRPAHPMGGLRDAKAFLAILAEGSPEATHPSWAKINERARLFFEAKAHVEAGAIGEAFVVYQSLIVGGTDDSFAQAAESAIARIETRALEELMAAAEATDLERADALLSEAKLKFSGSPIANDFRAVGAALKKDRRFPLLSED